MHTLLQIFGKGDVRPYFLSKVSVVPNPDLVFGAFIDNVTNVLEHLQGKDLSNAAKRQRNVLTERSRFECPADLRKYRTTLNSPNEPFFTG